MDWNSRTPVQWDWETLGLFNGEEAELSKPSKDRKSSKHESGIAIGTDYAYSMGMAMCSSSEVGDCSFRSSNAASADSSKAKKRIPEINRSVEGLLHNHRVVISRTSDPYIGTSIKNSTSSSHIISSTVFAEKSRVCEKSTLSPYCQVEGCNIDLATAKDYHRKHRVCEEHAKFPEVTVGGQECRFCQQCSRFHALSEFDQQKRSCRKRLFYHNARRRKPQLGATSFSSPTPPASFYDDGQRANLMLVQAPFSQTTTRASSIRDHSSSLPHTQNGESSMKSSKTKGVKRQLILPSGGLLFNGSAVSHDMGWLLRHGAAAAEVLDQGLEPNIAFHADADRAPDVRSARSLLSTKSHTPNRGTTSNSQFAYANKSNDAARPTLHTFNETKGLATTPLFGSESDGGSFRHPSSKTSFGTGLFDSSQSG